MTNFEVVLLLMACLAGLASVTDKLRIPYPILLVIAGLVIGFIPSIPDIHLGPDLIFLIFLPPLLYEAAGNISWHEFRKFRRPIATLSIWLVFFTTMAVAVVAHLFIPGFSWPLAFVLGAIVSPPDAVAATSATQGLGIPKRIISILEGESLVNDASALIAYRYAIAAVVSGSFVLWRAGMQFLLVAGGGIAIGLGIGYIFSRVHHRLENPTVGTTLTLLVPYLAYLLAEHWHFSGVLAVVSTGLYISWHSYEIYSFQTRLRINGFWNILIFLLNGFVFILIGSQLPIILQGISQYSLPILIGYGLLVSVTAILARIIWIYPYAYLSSHFRRWQGRTPVGFTPKELFIISWAGMRGVVSLATALAIPFTLAGDQPFPQRNVMLFITFVVIFVTLVMQGLSLPFFVRWLNVQESEADATAEETRLRLTMAHNSIDYIESELSLNLHDRVLNELKENFEHQINFLNGTIRLEETTRQADQTSPPALFKQYLESELKVLHNQRERIIQWHKEGQFNEEAIRKIEEELDIRTLSLQTQLQRLTPRAIGDV